MEKSSQPQRLIIGISGASGAVYGIRILEILLDTKIETHLVVTPSAQITITQETEYSLSAVESLADVVHKYKNIGASLASGSYPVMGMIVAPCSIHSLSEIAYGLTSNLLSRAADVTLKEKRRLVLMVRETPLHLGHLRAMTAAAEADAVIMPPVPAFYARPKTVDDLVTYTAARTLDLFGIHLEMQGRWTGMSG